MRNDDTDIQFFGFYCSHNAIMLDAFTPAIQASAPLSGPIDDPPR